MHSDSIIHNLTTLTTRSSRSSTISLVSNRFCFLPVFLSCHSLLLLHFHFILRTQRRKCQLQIIFWVFRQFSIDHETAFLWISLTFTTGYTTYLAWFSQLVIYCVVEWYIKESLTGKEIRTRVSSPCRGTRSVFGAPDSRQYNPLVASAISSCCWQWGLLRKRTWVFDCAFA